MIIRNLAKVFRYIKYFYFLNFKKDKIFSKSVLSKNMLGESNSFYNHGYEIFGKYDEYLKFKEYYSKIFYNITPNLKKLIKTADKSLFHLGEDSYLWSFNLEEGIVDCRIFNKEHIIGRSHILEHNINYNTNSDPYKNFFKIFPNIKKLLDSEKNKRIVDNIFPEGLRCPYMIKVEKKLKSKIKIKYNENYVHLDVFNTNYKLYIYLTDVNKDTGGAIQMIKGTHHHRKYSRIKEILFLNKNKFFKMNSNALKRITDGSFFKLNMDAGSIFGFTGSLLHSATDLKDDNERWTIQFYYSDPNTTWETDKLY